MKRSVIAILSVVVLLSSLVGAAPASAAGQASSSPMPPNPEKILSTMIARGQVPADASAAEKQAAIDGYLKQKLSGVKPDGNPLASKKLTAREDLLNQQASSDTRGRKLGNTTQVPASSPTWKSLAGTDKLLLMLVEFSDTPYTWAPNGQEPRTAAGPLHNQIPVPDNDFDLYVPDFSTQHFEDMLFTPGGWTIPADSPRYAGEHRGSMRDYYLEQSFGQYTIDGKAYGWYQVGKPEAYYGDDDPAGGHDNLLPGTTKNLISDVVDVINGQNAINWLEYDQLDLYDLDGDGDVNEPDCIIDHPLFIHAGIDQSGGGGAQGNDSIWAHSSSTSKWVTTQKNPGATCPASWPGTRIYNYTIMPEDGGVGVFAHEFGHDLGLPDEYDTAYSGAGDSVAFWSLMSSGSWVGRPAQTQPSDISIWGRYSLGWANDNIQTVKLEELSKQTPTVVRLEQAERWGGEGTLNGLRISLPNKGFFINTPHAGSWEWYGGKADEIDTTLRRAVDLTGKTSASLSFWTWYKIEEGWDFGFVQVSADGGTTWTSLPIAGTTDVIDPGGYPEIFPNLPGFSGDSGGWVQKTYDLKDYLGKSIQLQFRYMTDWATSLDGFFVDDIAITADGATVFADDVETEAPGWTATGWTRTQGKGYKPHYYMLEYRNTKPFETPYEGASLVNFDNGLSNVYQFDIGAGGNPNQPGYFPYTPGVLLWYRDQTYTDNWTGAHPGGGYLLVVDAHPRALMMPDGFGPWRTRVLSYDATFGLQRPADISIPWSNVFKTYQSLQALPNFDDTHSYWSNAAPYASVQTPIYQVTFRVTGEAKDGSAAVVQVGLK